MKHQLEAHILDLPCSRRVTNILVQRGFETVRDVVQTCPAQMLKYRGFGGKSLRDLRDALREFGLQLRGTAWDWEVRGQ